MNDLFPFQVERWNASNTECEEVIATSGNAVVALAAFDAAVRQYPKSRLMLCNGARVMSRHEPSVPSEG